MRDCFVVGCGRSGTSMVAAVLAAAGYHAGHQLIPPDQGNPAGYFEDVTVNAVNDELLAGHAAADDGHGSLRRRLAAGERWLAALPADLEITPSLDQQARMAATLTGHPARCRKDPQFCYTLPAWQQLLPQAVSVCVFREPTRTAHSLRTHVAHLALGFGYAEAMRLWCASYRTVLDRHAHTGTWVFCHYQQILDGTALTRVEHALEAALAPQRRGRRTPPFPRYRPRQPRGYRAVRAAVRTRRLPRPATTRHLTHTPSRGTGLGSRPSPWGPWASASRCAGAAAARPSRGAARSRAVSVRRPARLRSGPTADPVPGPTTGPGRRSATGR